MHCQSEVTEVGRRMKARDERLDRLCMARAINSFPDPIDIAIQENLPNALTLVTRCMKALLLGEPNRRVRCSDT